MPLFSRLLASKKAADTHLKSTANNSPSSPTTHLQPQTPTEPAQEQPYRHIPTHALSDSLNLGTTMPTPGLQERIARESKRYSKRPASLRRTGSETFLDEMAKRRSRIDLKGEMGTANAGKGKGKERLSLAPTSDPYGNVKGSVGGLQSPRAVRSPLRSMRGSPVPSTRSARSPLARSITEESEEPLVTPPLCTLDARKGGRGGDVDGYFPLQK